MNNQAPVEPPKSKMELISEAVDVLRRSRNPLSPGEMFKLAEQLKTATAFNYARRILARAAGDATLEQGKLKLKIYQRWSLCTYKDSDLPADARLDKALNILCQIEDLATATNQETLGIAGAIYKRKWEIDNQKLQLERSLLYYRRGYEQGAANDQGYNGINAAFVLDLLAYQEEEAAAKINSTSDIAKERRAEAHRIREDITQVVPPLADKPETAYLKKEWRFYSTVAEAHFGIGNYDEAVNWLERGEEKTKPVADWEKESTLKQLARLAILQSGLSETGDEFLQTPPGKALCRAFGNNAAAVSTAFVGKIGLGLSGGGFRASLFHIGMLARLAELDILRHVEVLSCVSGGSIIGAHYYLEVRKLLEDTPDGEITKEDYIKIIRDIERDFLLGVQRNVRMRIAAEIWTNLKMIFLPGYSRSLRAGELYEEEIFSRVKDGGGRKNRYLNELNICPKDETENFSPRLHNWRREAKTPILLLNATTLNTGHNWQFTTTWMGEPPSGIDVEIDTNDLYRRMYYSEAPIAEPGFWQKLFRRKDDTETSAKGYQIRLGHAVSASAAVPGIFEPLSLANLYPDRVVRLADGGGTDNQGLGGLLEQDCTVVLISDGSGQMESQNTPSGGLFGVLLRSSSILQSRIRDVQYHDLERRKRSSLLRGLMFIHLKEGLDTDPINWIDCLDPFESGIDARAAAEHGVLTRYGIHKKMQTCLAAIRTDLDSFSDVEAYTLMTSAYRMTEVAFADGKCLAGFSDKGTKGKWKFLEVEPDMKGSGEKYEYAMKLLDTSDSIAFKIWKQSTPLKYLAGFLILAAVVLIGWWCYTSSQLTLVNITLGTAGKWIVGLFLVAVATHFFGWLVKVARWRETLFRLVFGVVMSLFGWLIARLHLHVFDKLCLRRGSLNKFRGHG